MPHLDIQVVGFSDQSSEISFLTVPNNSPKSAYFIQHSDKPVTDEDPVVLPRNDTKINQPGKGDPLNEKEKVPIVIIGQRQSTCTMTILPEITSKPVRVTTTNSNDVEVTKCAMSELLNPIPALEKVLNPEKKQSNSQNTTPSSNISDEVSVIGRNIMSHDATKIYLHNILDFNPGIVKHTGLSCDKCVHRLNDQKPWKYSDTLHLRISRWIHTVQNATCSSKQCEPPLFEATSNLDKTSPDSQISLTEVSAGEKPDVLKSNEGIRENENVHIKQLMSPSRIQCNLDDAIDNGKYDSSLTNETHTDTASASQPDSSKKISTTSTSRVRPILKCWSDIWPLSTNAYLQRKEISCKLKNSPEENPKEGNHKEVKEKTNILVTGIMNVDSIGMKENEQEKTEVNEKIEENTLSSNSSFSTLDNLEAKSSRSDITPEMHPVKDTSESKHLNTLLDDSNILSHGIKSIEVIGPHQTLKTRDVPCVLVFPSIPCEPSVQDVTCSPDVYSVPVIPSVTGLPSIQDGPSSPDVHSVLDLPNVPKGPDITRVQVTGADVGKYEHLNSPGLAEGENYFFQAMVDKRYNRWKRRRQKKENIIRPKTCLPPAYINTSSSSEEDVQRRAASGYGSCIQNVVNSNTDFDRRRRKTGKKRSSGKGNRKCSHTKISKEDKLAKLNGYDASSEYTSSEKDEVQGSESDCDDNRSHTNSDINLNSDDNIFPVMKQQKHSSMSTIDVTSSDLLDVLGNNLWLPPINDQMTSSEKNTYPIDMGQPDINETHLLKLNTKKSASSSKQPGLKEALHKKVHRQAIEISRSKSRVTKQSISSWIKNSQDTSGDNKHYKYIPDKHNAADEKPYLPMLIQNKRDQTFLKLGNRPHVVAREVSRPTINQVPRKTCGVSAKGVSNYRHGSDPRRKRMRPRVQMSTTVTHLLPYNRKSDVRSVSKNHVQQKTVTPQSSRAGSLEGNRRFNLQRETESTVSNLSFTPAFTFSIFKLPLDYKLRNEKWNNNIIGHALQNRI
ncbi:hypothetical protein ACJMK2_015915 [Sinanodonta woodiana]|uniref:Uncharacterized protein n=1 Tax=Sinanodonta woodiana TaxID=1069815 RepID=A0ABD3UVL4_SINWO